MASPIGLFVALWLVSVQPPSLDIILAGAASSPVTLHRDFDRLVMRDTRVQRFNGALGYSRKMQSVPAETDLRAFRVGKWLDAINHHEPGTADDAMFTVAGFGEDIVRGLLGDLTLLLDRYAAEYERFRAGKGPVHVSYGGAAFSLEHVATFLRLEPEEALRRDATRILKRAAMLHAELAMLIDMGRLPPARSSGRQADAIRTDDGEAVGFEVLSVHWDLGRRLLAGTRPDAGNDSFVRQWYLAGAAFMLARSNLAELAPHMEAARRLFPRDPEILFYSGVLHESLAARRVQHALQSLPRDKRVRVRIRPIGAELDVAERFFAEALQRDPGMIEATLRRARVLAIQGHHLQASTMFRLVLDTADEKLVKYLAALFLGEEERILGRRDHARDAFEQAAALYPNAQSPRLGIAQLARNPGERADALDALRRVGNPIRVPNADDEPWWTYDTAAARHVDALIKGLYEAFKAAKLR